MVRKSHHPEFLEGFVYSYKFVIRWWIMPNYFYIAKSLKGEEKAGEIEAQDENEAAQKINDVCNKVLINPIMEGFEYEIKEIK